MEPARQCVEEEAADELVGGEGHDLLPCGAGLAIILVAEGDPGLVEPEEGAVRYGDPVGVSRQIGEDCLGPGERLLGINDPALFADPRQVPQECGSLGELREAAKESEFAVIVQARSRVRKR